LTLLLYLIWALVGLACAAAVHIFPILFNYDYFIYHFVNSDAILDRDASGLFCT
jgi:hypothetical protein